MAVLILALQGAIAVFSAVALALLEIMGLRQFVRRVTRLLALAAVAAIATGTLTLFR